MKSLFKFLKTTLVGGFLFLLPLVLSIFLIREAVRWGGKILEPTVRFLSLHSFLGVQAQYLLAIFFLVLFAFLAGLLARTHVGELLRQKLENVILQRMPGYTLMRGLAGVDPTIKKDDFKPALVRIAPGKLQMAFVVERHADGWMTVFIPSAPNPTSGTVQMISSEHLIELKKPPKELVMCLMKIGEGFEKLAAGEVEPDSAS
jgi:uncharacterized membrane protein